MRKILVILTIALALGFSTRVGAAIIYDNGLGDGSRGWWSDFDQGQQIADNFSLSAGANTITDVHWSGSYWSGNTPSVTDDFTLRIFSDAGGVPSVNPTFSFNVGNAVNRIDSGIDDATWNIDIYNYSANISPLTLTAGTTYWLSVLNDTAGNSDDWLWENSSPQGSSAWRTPEGSSWRHHTAELAFQLTNDDLQPVPEPATVALLGIGLAGLAGGAARRKWKKKAVDKS